MTSFVVVTGGEKPQPVGLCVLQVHCPTDALDCFKEHPRRCRGLDKLASHPVERAFHGHLAYVEASITASTLASTRLVPIKAPKDETKSIEARVNDGLASAPDGREPSTLEFLYALNTIHDLSCLECTPA